MRTALRPPAPVLCDLSQQWRIYAPLDRVGLLCPGCAPDLGRYGTAGRWPARLTRPDAVALRSVAMRPQPGRRRTSRGLVEKDSWPHVATARLTPRPGNRRSGYSKHEMDRRHRGPFLLYGPGICQVPPAGQSQSAVLAATGDLLRRPGLVSAGGGSAGRVARPAGGAVAGASPLGDPRLGRWPRHGLVQRPGHAARLQPWPARRRHSYFDHPRG